MPAERIDTEPFTFPSSSSLSLFRPRRVSIVSSTMSAFWWHDVVVVSRRRAKSNRSLPRWKEIAELQARWRGKAVSSSSTRVLPPPVSSRCISYVSRNCHWIFHEKGPFLKHIWVHSFYSKFRFSYKGVLYKAIFAWASVWHTWCLNTRQAQ